jgi:tRNA A58 N-methylase Trm61
MEDELVDNEADASSVVASVNIVFENSDVLPDESFVDDEELKEESLDTISAITHADESVYTEGTALGYKKYTDLHIHIQSKLRQSRLLQPEWIEVTNVSYQYAMRKKLRPKRRMSIITKLHASNGESFLTPPFREFSSL